MKQAYRRLVTLAASVVLIVASRALAWGEYGHRIIGHIAYHFADDTTKATLKDLLGDESLADAGCWADEIRSDPKYDWVKPLHYVNVPRDAQSYDAKRDCETGQCVVAAIETYSAVVADRSKPKAERVEALKLLVHFIGDIHQPLHVSYAKDRGGNSIDVTAFGKKSNLHRVWDTDLIKHRMKGGWPILAADLRQAITEQDRTAWEAATDPATWANESLAITRSLYEHLPSDAGVGEEYYRQHISTVEERLKTAGIRLSATLNRSLASIATAGSR